MNGKAVCRRSVLLLAVAAAAVVVGVPSAVADPPPDPLTEPSCYLSSGCGGGTSIPNIADAHTSVTDGTVGEMALMLPALATGLEEVPVTWAIPGLQEIDLAVAAGGLALAIGSVADHVWFHGDVTDTAPPAGSCYSWFFRWGGTNPFGTGLTGDAYLDAKCGPNSSDTYAGSPHSSYISDPNQYDFYQALLALTTIHEGGLVQVASSYCDNSSPCYTWMAGIDAIVGGLTGPFSSNPDPHATRQATGGWADPLTGKGITQSGWGYGYGPTDPNPQCLQNGAPLPCTSVDPNGPPVTPLNGLPYPWGTDGYANPEANNLRCQLAPAAFACPGPSSDGSNDWGNTGGPLVTMPYCYGGSVDACEAAVNSALAAAGSAVEAGFDTTIAPTYDPNIPVGAVVATVPAVGTQSDLSAVEIEENEEDDPALFCSAHSDFYHPSLHSDDNNMLAVFYVHDCNFASPPNVLLSAEAWNCTSEPEQNLALISQQGNPWGCVLDGPPVTDYSVTANGALKGTFGYLNGPPYDPSKWYVAYVWSDYDSPVVEPAWSETTGPNTWPTSQELFGG